jgi:hypothetical protein
VFNAVDTTRVSRAAISDPTPVSTTAHVRKDFELIPVETPTATGSDR